MNFSKDNPVNRLLLDRDMTQTELAQILNIDRAHLCRVCNGKGGPALPTKYKVSKYFQRPMNELFPNDVA